LTQSESTRLPKKGRSLGLSLGRIVGPLAALLLAGAGCGAAARRQLPPYQHFRSRPDLKPPLVTVLTAEHRRAPGYVFIAPKKHVAQAGPLILDNRGQVVWFRPLDTRGVTDFRVQRYRGRNVLTWWRGRPADGLGTGGYTIADSAYRTIAVVRPGHGLVGDIHEFLITPRNTALLTIFHRIRRDLSALGGARDADVFEGVVQEVDIATGRVLFEWHSIDHVAPVESYYRPPRPDRSSSVPPYDYFHVNSIDVDNDGNLLVSARNTHAVYKISRRSGRILWRLGGKRSDFAFGPGARFAWQHDARRRPDGTITLFDNEAAPKTGPQSRAIVLRVDTRRRSAILVRRLVHRHPSLLSADQGNVQLLPDGHYLVGWGAHPYVTEFDRRGRVLFDLRFDTGADSYRAYRFPWRGRPRDRPALAVAHGRGGTEKLFVSWNGATDVRRWQLLAGNARGSLVAVRTVAKTGFETEIAFRGGARYAAVEALAADGKGLARSQSVAVPHDKN
jgi:hypothetical protein